MTALIVALTAVAIALQTKALLSTNWRWMPAALAFWFLLVVFIGVFVP